MGPIFEQGPVPFQGAGQEGRPVGLVAGEQDHVMCALDRGDGVDLDEPHRLDHPLEPRGVQLLARCRAEALALQQEASGVTVGDDGRGRHGIETP
jgi:hypothetical protein